MAGRERGRLDCSRVAANEFCWCDCSCGVGTLEVAMGRNRERSAEICSKEAEVDTGKRGESVCVVGTR